MVLIVPKRASDESSFLCTGVEATRALPGRLGNAKIYLGYVAADGTSDAPPAFYVSVCPSPMTLLFCSTRGTFG